MATPENVQDKNVLIIVGPTATGKTGLSLELSSIFNSEIVSCDSRQVYKYMDIGTAKPTDQELQQVIHHFINNKFPDEYYSAGIYAKEARIVIANILNTNKLPIVVGGSGLYLRALVDGFFEAEIFDNEIKNTLKQRLAQHGLAVMYEKLSEIDPVLASRLHPNDTQRILRALEVWEITGIPLSKFQEDTNVSAGFNPVFIGLTMERNFLYQRIEARVDKMLNDGLIDEVRNLNKLGYDESLSSLQTVGYKEVFQYFKKTISYDNMIRLIKQKTRNYAKRQMTWFNKDDRIVWFDINRLKNIDIIVKEINKKFV